MAEIGLVRFAGLALEVSEVVLPAQRTKFSKAAVHPAAAAGGAVSDALRGLDLS
jgi:hypothetical protein